MAKKIQAERASSPPRWPHLWVLLAIFVVSVAIRIPGIFTLGMGLDGPGTWQIVNWDENNSCDAALGYLSYPTFVGRQVLWIARQIGYPPPDNLPTPEQATALFDAAATDRAARVAYRAPKTYCRTRPLILIHRFYSVVTGALTVVLVGAIALLMWPRQPQIAWTAALLLAFSNLHVADSHTGTLDVPQVFFIVLLTAALSYAVAKERRWPLVISPLLLLWAVLTKWYVFAVLAYACVVKPSVLWEWRRAIAAALLVAIVMIAALAMSWEPFRSLANERWYLVWGSDSGPFGTSYGHIGTWRRWIRNVTNLPIVFGVGMGVPVLAFSIIGLRHVLKTRDDLRLWLAQAPALAYAAYMIVIGPVTYYRHYLPLFPAIALLAAYGFWQTRFAHRKLLLALFVAYPLLLTVDSEWSYWRDPRLELRPWLASRPGTRLRYTFYVAPPPDFSVRDVFRDRRYLAFGSPYLAARDYLVMSEAWYDTAFPNELNGPIAWKPEWLIKTTPELALMHRRILSGQDPALTLEAEFTLRPFTPELMLHRAFYGSFQPFVGDLKIYKVRNLDPPKPAVTG